MDEPANPDHHGGDPTRHLTGAELAARLAQAVQSPRDRGAVVALVARPASGERFRLERARLTIDRGLDGDRWSFGKRDPESQVTLELTPKPHTGCKKYRARFGLDALTTISNKAVRHRRMRGVHVRVVQGGDVAVGDPVEVVGSRRPVTARSELFGHRCPAAEPRRPPALRCRHADERVFIGAFAGEDPGLGC